MKENLKTHRRIEAIRAPIGYAGTGNAHVRLERLRSECARLLENEDVFVRLQGNEHFISTLSCDSLYFPQSSQLSGNPRYQWVDRGDGVLYGYSAQGSEVI